MNVERKNGDCVLIESMQHASREGRFHGLEDEIILKNSNLVGFVTKAGKAKNRWISTCVVG